MVRLKGGGKKRSEKAWGEKERKKLLLQQGKKGTFFFIRYKAKRALVIQLLGGKGRKEKEGDSAPDFDGAEGNGRRGVFHEGKRGRRKYCLIYPYLNRRGKGGGGKEKGASRSVQKTKVWKKSLRPIASKKKKKEGKCHERLLS